MVPRRRQCFVVFPAVLLALAGPGCGGGSQSLSVESVTKEAKVEGMAVTLSIKDQKAPELSWVVTDRVVADFSGHHVEVAKNQVISDGKTKKLPPRTEMVQIDFEKDVVTIRANGTPIFGPNTK